MSLFGLAPLNKQIQTSDLLLTDRPIFRTGCSDRFIIAIRTVVLIVGLFVFQLPSLQAQTDTWGREFYLSLFPNAGPFNPPKTAPRPRAYLYFYSLEETTVEVTFGKSDPIVYDLSPGGKTIEISKENLEKITATKKNAKNGRASIHVVS